MTTRINTNTASLRGLRSLNRANNVLGQAMTRLSTGLKINSGKDDPAGLIASEMLRSQITAIEQSIKNSNRANNVIATADAALGEIGGLLNQVRGLIQEGLNSGAMSRSELEANQLQIDAALSAINRIAANTKFAGDKLIDGSKAFVTQMTAADKAKLSDLQINEALFGSNETIQIEANVAAAAQKGELLYTGGGLSEAASLEIAGARGSQVLFFGASSTVDNIRDAINAVKDVTGVEATIATEAVAGTVNIGAGNAEITFTDARTTDGTGVFSEQINIEFVDPGANSSPLSVSVNTDGDGNKTILVSLATDGAGAITSTANDVIAAVNGNAEASALVSADTADGSDGTAVVAVGDVTLADGTDGELLLSSTAFGSRQFVDVNALNGTFVTYLNNGTTEATRNAGSDIVVTINGQQAQADGLRASVKTMTLDASLTFAENSNVTGETTTVNIIGGGSLFQIGQDVSVAGQVGLGIEAVNTARLGGVTGKLFELGSGGGKSLLDVGPDVPGGDLVDIVDQAINRIATMRGRLGALQKNVIETNIESLGVALENITDARSQILDADFAEETAQLTRGQILSQAGISVLAIANQNPAQVLSLLG